MILNRNIQFTSAYHYYKFIIDVYLTVRKINYPEQIKNTLLFFIIYGVNKKTYQLIVDKKIATSINIVNVYKTRLANEGLIVKVKKSQWEVIEDLNIKENNFTFTLNLSKV